MALPNTFAFYSQASWPNRIRHLLDKNFAALCQYEVEQERIDEIARRPVSVGNAPAPNQFAEARTFLLSELNVSLRDANLVGAHCTRLCEDEIELITSVSGLQPMSTELAHARVGARRAAGELTEAQATQLLAGEFDASGANGAGGAHMALAFTQGTLGRDQAVGKYFRSWGGETLARQAGADAELKAALAALGTPCIVEVEVPVASIDVANLIAERLVTNYLRHKGVDAMGEVELVGQVQGAIPAERVLRVVRRSDAEFERIVVGNKWKPKLK